MAWRKQDWSPRADVEFPREGGRVVTVREIERFPHFLVKKGARGTIVEFDPSNMISVRMDRRIPGADEWDNEIHWAENADQIEEFFLDVQPLKAKGR